MTSIAPTQLKLKYINNPITFSSPWFSHNTKRSWKDPTEGLLTVIFLHWEEAAATQYSSKWAALCSPSLSAMIPPVECGYSYSEFAQNLLRTFAAQNSGFPSPGGLGWNFPPLGQSLIAKHRVTLPPGVALNTDKHLQTRFVSFVCHEEWSEMLPFFALWGELWD